MHRGIGRRRVDQVDLDGKVAVGLRRLEPSSGTRRRGRAIRVESVGRSPKGGGQPPLDFFVRGSGAPAALRRALRRMVIRLFDEATYPGWKRKQRQR